MLATEKVNQFYGGSHTLWDVDLDVPVGGCVCLMGRNGVGKTTLLKVIMGLLPAVSGKIRFGDAELSGQRPELLLVDEPVAGMTPQETERTAHLLQSLAGRHSVVVVEHDMEFVRSIARRVIVLHEGRVLAEGSMEHVQNDQRVIDVYLGA